MDGPRVTDQDEPDVRDARAFPQFLVKGPKHRSPLMAGPGPAGHG